jgi:ATP/maltotriose-dependent transcriptional regulator MalT
LVQSIRRLPDETVAHRPWLVAAQGLLLLQQGHSDAGRPLAEQAAAQFAQRGDDLGRLYMLLALASVTAGEAWAQLLQQVEPVIAARGEEIPARWRVSFHNNTSWWNIYALDWPVAEDHLRQAVDLAVASGQEDALYILVKNDFFTLFFSTAATAAITRLERALLRLPAGDLLARYGLLNIRLCRNWFQGHVGEAEAAAKDAQAISGQLGGFGYADAAAIFVLIGVQWARGELDALAAQLESVIGLMPHDVARNDVLGLLALVRWQQRRAGAVRQALQEMEAHTHFARHRVNNDIVRGLLAGIDGNLTSADGHLRSAIDLQRRVGHAFLANAHLMLAVVYWQAGERHSALRVLDLALDEWERKGQPGVVLQSGRTIIPLLEAAVAANVHADFSKRCLDAFGIAGRPRRITVPGTGQTLTPREAEVLALIVKGKSNPEIAAELVITERTVKSHVTNILSKLKVSSRTAAAVMARDLDLL